ncbi:hypothetical protein GH714_014300 [Hevea brasiliensis]|uniref:RNase H type-1 domain-containing protein n=1 Tax=Hevea brasiliensis TaxID=3981 RepID=A0A6A6KBU7_HEVBR|nr:hypothetical protein GH714_014300 [Hevea brasiliensis]
MATALLIGLWLLSMFIGRSLVLGHRSYGLREVLSWLLARKCGDIDIAIDVYEVSNALDSNKVNLAEFSLIIDECRFLLRQILNASLRWVRRRANRVAHFAAGELYYMVAP